MASAPDPAARLMEMDDACPCIDGTPCHLGASAITKVKTACVCRARYLRTGAVGVHADRPRDLHADEGGASQMTAIKRLAEEAHETSGPIESRVFGIPVGFLEECKKHHAAIDALAAAGEGAERRACHHGWRGTKPDDGEQIADPCLSCGTKSLFIGSGGHLTCARVPVHGGSDGCKQPALADQIASLTRQNAALRKALGYIAESEWDDVDPDDGLHDKSVRAFARAALKETP